MPYVENRVRVVEFGSLPSGSPLLVPVPTTPGKAQQYLHRAVAPSFLDLARDAKMERGYILLVASGHRTRRWPTKDAYEKALINRYTMTVTKNLGRRATRDEILKHGRTYWAFASPHETGLVLDLGCHGLEPVSATIDKQKRTGLYLWLVGNMWRYGWTPYLPEPWHIEHRVPISEYKTHDEPDEIVCEDEEC